MSHMNFYFIYSQPFLVLNIHISKEIGTQEKKLYNYKKGTFLHIPFVYRVELYNCEQSGEWVLVV